MNPHCVKVLLVEDDGDTSRYIQAALSRHAEPSFQTFEAGSLADGLRFLHDLDVDVVLLDLDLPDSHGLETLDTMLGHPRAAAIVVLTAEADKRIGARAVDMGAQDFLVKGEIDDRLLAKAIHYALMRHDEAVKLFDALRAAEKAHTNFRRVITSLPEAFFVVGLDERVLFVNPAGETLLGKPSGEIVGHPAPFSGRGDGSREVSVTRADGARLAAEMAVVPGLWEDAAVRLYSLRDVTERNHRENERADAERHRVMAESLLAACHHLNQPLTVLSGHLDLLAEHLPPGNADVRRRVDRCVEATRRLTRLSRKMEEIRSYRTVPYLTSHDVMMVDLEGATVAGDDGSVDETGGEERREGQLSGAGA